MKRFFCLVILLLLCSRTHLPAQAADTLFSPGKIALSEVEITSEEIRDRGYDNLDELLAAVPGVFISHDRTFTQIGLRSPSPTATNNQRVQVLLDGIPMNSPFTGDAPSGYDLQGINMEDIEKVVIIKNPSPVFEGNNALMGVVKIITKKAAKRLRVNFDVGSFGELDGGFAFGQSFGKMAFGLSGRLANLQGQELYFPGDVLLSKEETDYGGVRLRFRAGKFFFNGSFLNRKEVVPAVPNNPFELEVDPEFVVDTSFRFFKEELDVAGVFKERSTVLDFGFASKIGERHGLEVRLFGNFNDKSRTQTFRDIEIQGVTDTFDLDTVGYIEYLESPTQRTLWTGLEYKHIFQIQSNHHLSWGTAVRLLPVSTYKNENTMLLHYDGDDFFTSEFWPEVLLYARAKEEAYDKNFSFWSAALFLEDRITFNEMFTLNAGARLMLSSQADPVVAPKVAIQFSPPGDRTQIMAGFSRGFRTPSVFENEVVISDNLISQPNPTVGENLVPELSNHFELGLQQKIGEGFNINLTGYYQQLQDLIWNETTMPQRQNDKTISITGIEGDINFKLPNNIQSYLNYNFPFNTEDLVNLPSPLCKFGVSIPFLKHFNLYTEGQYDGGRLGFDGNYTLPYFLLNSNLRIQPNLEGDNWLEQVSFAFRVFNLLDEYYVHPSGQAFTTTTIPQNGRTWQAQITYGF